MVNYKVVKRHYKEKAMKRKITDKSIELFERKGFTQTSIQDIVDELGVTKGTFYYYYSSKEQLLMDIHLEYIDELLAQQKEIINCPNSTNKEKLVNLIEQLIKDIRKNGARGRVFFREIRHLSEDNIAIVKEKRNQVRLNIESVIRHGIESGEFKAELDADIISFAVLSLTNYSYQWYKPHGRVSEDELVQMYTNLLFEGIVKE